MASAEVDELSESSSEDEQQQDDQMAISTLLGFQASEPEEPKEPEEDGSENEAGEWEDSDDEITWCGMCEERKAVVLCAECADYFCAICSNRIHRVALTKHTLSQLGAPIASREQEQRISEQQEAARKAKLAAWLESEQSSNTQSFKSGPDAAPDQLCLYEDLQHCLFDLPSANSREMLCLGMLHFLGVAELDLDHIKPSLPCASWLLGPVSKLSAALECDPAKLRPIRSMMPIKDRPESELSLIGRVTEQLVVMFPKSQQFCELRLWFASQTMSAQAFRKIAKALLKQDPSNWLLWAHFAKLELGLGNVSEARRIYANVLAMASGVQQRASLALSALKLELTDGGAGEAAALWLLLFTAGVVPEPANPDEASPLPMLVLTARRTLQAKLPDQLRQPHDIELAACFCWLEALCNRIDELHLFIDAVISICAPEAKQKVYETHVEVVSWHVKARTSSLQPLHHAVMQGLRSCPGNITMLAALASSSQHSWAHFRRMLSSMCRKQSDPKLWLFYLQSQVQAVHGSFRPGAADHTAAVHRARTVFEAILAQPVWQPISAVLWWLFIQLELKVGSVAAAKRHFFRAIQVSPWCKAIWAEFGGGLREVLRSEDMAELAQLMVQKGLGWFNAPPSNMLDQ